MDLMVLNENFEQVAVLDSLISIIWTDRYNGAGDFEIYTPVTFDSLQYLAHAGYYLRQQGSEHMMIIESFEIATDVEDGTQLIITERRYFCRQYRHIHCRSFCNAEPLA